MDRLWWNVTEYRFIEDITSALTDEKSVILYMPEAVAWRDTLEQLLIERITISCGRQVDRHSFPQEEPGAFLLEEYCRRELREQYRYGISYASFLGKCEETVLNDRCVWITGIPYSSMDQWVKFVGDYNKYVRDRAPAIFILESSECNGIYQQKRGLRTIVHAQYANRYNKILFCSLASQLTECREYMQGYLAELAAAVCGEDMELCAECIGEWANFLHSPVETARSMTAERYRNDGSMYCLDESDERIEQAIWEVQLRQLFPVIEKYRNAFIKRHYDEIVENLPIQTEYVNFDVPEDVEIGNLLFLAKGNCIITSQEEKETLGVYKKTRDDLAHLRIVDYETVDLILHDAHMSLK